MGILLALIITGLAFGFHVPFIIIGSVFLFCFGINLATGLLDWFERVWE